LYYYEYNKIKNIGKLPINLFKINQHKNNCQNTEKYK